LSRLRPRASCLRSDERFPGSEFNFHLRFFPVPTRAIAAWIISRSGDVRTDNCQLRHGTAELAFDRAEARADRGTVRCRSSSPPAQRRAVADTFRKADPTRAG